MFPVYYVTYVAGCTQFREFAKEVFYGGYAALYAPYNRCSLKLLSMAHLTVFSAFMAAK